MKLKALLFLIVITTVVASCKKSTNVNLGGKFRLINSASFNDLTIVREYNIVVVPGHVLEYSVDSTFILVAQRPRDSVAGKETMTLKKYEEAFRQSNFRQYWIVNKESGKINGPLKKEKYLLMSKELGVPASLKLKD